MPITGLLFSSRLLFEIVKRRHRITGVRGGGGETRQSPQFAELCKSSNETSDTLVRAGTNRPGKIIGVAHFFSICDFTEGPGPGKTIRKHPSVHRVPLRNATAISVTINRKTKSPPAKRNPVTCSSNREKKKRIAEITRKIKQRSKDTTAKRRSHLYPRAIPCRTCHVVAKMIPSGI